MQIHTETISFVEARLYDIKTHEYIEFEEIVVSNMPIEPVYCRTGRGDRKIAIGYGIKDSNFSIHNNYPIKNEIKLKLNDFLKKSNKVYKLNGYANLRNRNTGKDDVLEVTIPNIRIDTVMLMEEDFKIKCNFSSNDGNIPITYEKLIIK